MAYFIGVELGQVSEVTAIAVVQSLTFPILRTERVYRGQWEDERPVYQAPDGTETREHPPVKFALRHLERMPAGTSYPEIVKRVCSLHARLENPAVILDATGVGRAAVELFRDSNFNLSILTLMAGDQMVQDGRSYRIPKRDVISRTQVLLQTERLRFARTLPDSALLARELVSFRFRVTSQGPEDALDWREGPQDDLVLALAIAAWEANRNPGLGFTVSHLVSRFRGFKGF